MSILSGANTNNKENISIQLRDREEFIEEFLRQKGYQNTSYISSPTTISYPRRQRWNYLHDFNKLYKTKLQEKREQQKILEDEKEMRECTFEPKLNKSISYINNGNNNKSYNSLLNLNLIERQDAWIEKRKNNIKQKEKEKQNEQMKNCFFTPEINNEDALKKTRIKTKTINLLEDPESYSMYIKRLQKKPALVAGIYGKKNLDLTVEIIHMIIQSMNIQEIYLGVKVIKKKDLIIQNIPEIVKY